MGYLIQWKGKLLKALIVKSIIRNIPWKSLPSYSTKYHMIVFRGRQDEFHMNIRTIDSYPVMF